MHPVDCPAWEYNQFPDYDNKLQDRIAKAIVQLHKGVVDTSATAQDTRPLHGRIFDQLTPPNCPYYAGHYRGESYRCLEYYSVHVPGDPRVGAAPHLVITLMNGLANEIQSGIAALDDAHGLSNAQLPVEDKIFYAVDFACRVLEVFLRIHPYANGNGHIARFITWCILGRYGYWPIKWPVHPRPPDPPYTQLIFEHRNGNHAPLVQFVLSCIAD